MDVNVIIGNILASTTLLLTSGGVLGILITWIFKWMFRRHPKSEKINYHQDGSVKSVEKTWR